MPLFDSTGEWNEIAQMGIQKSSVQIFGLMADRCVNSVEQVCVCVCVFLFVFLGVSNISKTYISNLCLCFVFCCLIISLLKNHTC